MTAPALAPDVRLEFSPPHDLLGRIVATLEGLYRADVALVAEDLTQDDRAAARARAGEALAAIQGLAYEVAEATAGTWDVDAVAMARENAAGTERAKVVRWLRDRGHIGAAVSIEHGEHCW